jgi:hypothetical protein
MAGKWLRLTRFSDAVALPPQDMRLQATAALRRAGYRYLLAPTRFDAYAKLGNRLLDEAPQWGLEKVAETGATVLFRVR